MGVYPLPWTFQQGLPTNCSATVIEKIGNKTSDAVAALQEEVSEIAKLTTQNRMALDMLLASQGGVWTVTNTSCCVYVDRSGRISTDLNEIWKQTEILHGVQKDDAFFRI